MERRVFLRLSLAGALSLAAPVAAPAQPVALRRIGLIASESRSAISDSFWDAFVVGLREHGWIESRNIVMIERRYAEARSDAPLVAVQELIRAGAEVIVVSSTRAALAAKQATRTVPIVMTVPSDPVAVGLVASLARPGGNVTGLSFMGTEVVGKQVELLNQAVPGLTSVAVLANPANASHPPRIKEVMAAARTLRVQVEVVEASSRPEIADALRTMVKRGAGAALILSDPVFVVEASSVIRAAARAAPASHVRTAGSSPGRRAHVLWPELHRPVPARGRLRRQDLARRPPPGSSHRAGVEVRAGHQSQDDPGARAHHPVLAPAPSGSRDRVRSPSDHCGSRQAIGKGVYASHRPSRAPG